MARPILLLAVAALAVLLTSGLACSSDRASQSGQDRSNQQQAAEQEKKDEPKPPSKASAEEQASAQNKPRADTDNTNKEDGTKLAAVLAGGGQAPEPGYKTLTDRDTRALSVEVPSGWEAMQDEGVTVELRTAEGAIIAQEGLVRVSITAAPEMEAWDHNHEGTGASLFVLKRLAQGFTDDQLLDGIRGIRWPSKLCSDGGREDFKRPPYSGRIQPWIDCAPRILPTYVTVAASPEGRRCVVMVQIGMADKAAREAAQHILDTFEVDCGAVPYPEPVASASVSASASASATAGQTSAPPASGASSPPDATPTPEPTPSPSLGSSPEPSGGDIDCDQVSGPVRVPPGDPHGLDRDGDGWGCE